MSEQLRYSLVIQWSDEDQAYIVSFPEWEAQSLIRHSHGDTYEEAVRKGQESPWGFRMPSCRTFQDRH